MTKQTKTSLEKSFVSAKLPWLIAAVALILYLFTLNPWVSLNNLEAVARTSGWMAKPELTNPLFYLATYPMRWLPGQWVPLAYNLFSLVCGVLSLALLTRSVAILPHDRTQDQRLRERNRFSLLSGKLAWVPPVLAALVCGLQLTFWENTTTGSSGMFDLLLFAYIIRCLLEFRIGEKDSWMFRAALVCGAAMANTWIMFILFPAFLVSVVWIKGFEFFNPQFLLKMFLFGLAGTLFYLLLPAIHVLSDNPIYSFWDALKENLRLDKQAFMFFARQLPANVRILLAMTSLLPILVIGIRWASNFGDPSKVGGALATWIFHLAHGALLAVCIWVAADPVFSPLRLGYAIPALYYLGALSVGYLSGYFLLVFTPLPDRMGRTTALQQLLCKVCTFAILALVAVVPAGLLWLNLPQVRMTNGPALREYASQLVARLPEQGVIISDDASKLYLAQASLSKQGKAGNHFFLDTQWLVAPSYHAFQNKLHGKQWPAWVDPKRKEQVGPRLLLNLMAKLSETNAICYLHPSFGYYFDYFDQRPRGLSLDLKPYSTNSPATNSLAGAPFTEAETAENEHFWTEAQTATERLIPFISPPAITTNVPFSQVLLKKLHIPFQANFTAKTLGAYYSQTLNFWGVQLQRAGNLDAAQKHFRTALDLFPNNIAARNNLAFNITLKAGQQPILRPPQSMENELVGKYRSWLEVLQDTGPFDDPTHCFTFGLAFAEGKLFRQAAQQLERVHALVPEDVRTSFWLARLYIMNQRPEKSLALLAEIRNETDSLAASGILRLDFLQAEATALFAANQPEKATLLLQDAVRNNPKDQNLLAVVAQVSSVFKSYTNALMALDQLLKLNPDNVNALVSKGVFNIQAGNFTNAIPPLTRALDLQATNYNAQLYRAVAYLRSDNFTEARTDYESLQKLFPNANEVNGGLAEIALHSKDTNTAIRYYVLCLKNSPTNSDQAKFFGERINNLKSGAK